MRKPSHIEWVNLVIRLSIWQKISNEPTNSITIKRRYVLLLSNNKKDNNWCNTSLRKWRERKCHILIKQDIILSWGAVYPNWKNASYHCMCHQKLCITCSITKSRSFQKWIRWNILCLNPLCMEAFHDVRCCYLNYIWSSKTKSP